MTGIRSKRPTAPQQKLVLFDYLVDNREQARRYGEAKLFGRGKIDNQVKFCRTNNRQITRLFAFQNSANICGGLAIRILKADAVAHQPAVRGCLACPIHGGNRLMRC